MSKELNFGLNIMDRGPDGKALNPIKISCCGKTYWRTSFWGSGCFICPTCGNIIHWDYYKATPEIRAEYEKYLENGQ